MSTTRSCVKPVHRSRIDAFADMSTFVCGVSSTMLRMSFGSGCRALWYRWSFSAIGLQICMIVKSTTSSLIQYDECDADANAISIIPCSRLRRFMTKSRRCGKPWIGAVKLSHISWILPNVKPRTACA